MKVNELGGGGFETLDFHRMPFKKKKKKKRILNIKKNKHKGPHRSAPGSDLRCMLLNR